MLKFKDANVLVVKEFPNRNISISSLMLSLGVKPHKIIYHSAPHEPLNRTFHDRFDILICDQSYCQNQVKASDLLHHLSAMRTIDDSSTIIMDCLDIEVKDSAYYLSDIHITPEDNQRDISEQIRRTFEKKNTVWPMLLSEREFSAQEMAKRYEFFEHHYPDYQYDLMLKRAHQHLLKRELKSATELYGTLIKEAGKKDYSLEVSFFLNAMLMNGQSEDALELYEKFDLSQVQFGQPFDQIGALLLLKKGHLQRGYRMLVTSGMRYGLDMTERTMLGLIGIILGKNEEALEHFSSNLAVSKMLKREVPQHMLNYMFALLMQWTSNDEFSSLYKKKYEHMLNEVSRLKLNEAENQQLAVIKLHGYSLTIGSQNAESTISTVVRKLPKLSCCCKVHALFLASGLNKKSYFTEIHSDIFNSEGVFMLQPLPPTCAALTRYMDFGQFARSMSRQLREKAC
ncbi:hypothetical protein NM22_11505 [Vibrio tubiashii]|nr:hypothetical protein NM22_11505 [Vibrio tubiashii]